MVVAIVESGFLCIVALGEMQSVIAIKHPIAALPLASYLGIEGIARCADLIACPSKVGIVGIYLQQKSP